MSAFAPVVRVGCGCLVQSSLYPGRVLLGRRLGSHGAGKFALPGGHLELGESWADCLRREVKEETNLDVDNFHLVHVTVSQHSASFACFDDLNYPLLVLTMIE